MFKKSLSAFLTVVLSLSIFTTVAFATVSEDEDTQTNGIILRINDPVIYLGNYLAFDEMYIDNNYTTPISQNGRTYIPASPIIQQLGGTVEWLGKEQKISMSLDGNTAILKVNSTSAVINGASTKVSAAPINYGGKVMLPIRVVSESLGLGLTWDNQNQVVSVFRPFFETEMPGSDIYMEWFASSEYEEPVYEETVYETEIQVGDIVTNGLFVGEVKEVNGSKIKVYWDSKTIFVPDGDEQFWATVLGINYKGNQWVESSDVTLESSGY